MTTVQPGRTYPLFGAATPANAITVSRIVLTPVLCSIVLADEATMGVSWAAFAIGLAMAFTDAIDGRVARATNGYSRSGAFLDPLADKIVILGVGFSLVAVNRVALVPIALIAVREVAISVLRIWYARRDVSIPASNLAKAKTTIQGIALLLAVMPVLQDQQLVIDIVLWIAVAITLWTGYEYLRDGEGAAARSKGYRQP